MTRISIVCPFWNSARFLSETIESVLLQSYTDWELLLVDDGSRDGTREIAKHYAERFPGRIHLLEHNQNANRGISASRNLAIDHAQGELLALIDSDDVWLPGKLQQQVKDLEKNPEAVMTFGAAERWYQWASNENGDQPDFDVPSTIPGYRDDALVAPPDLLEAYLRDESKTPCTCTVLARMSEVIAAGGFVNEFAGLYDDQVFHARLCATHPVYVSSTCFGRYRQHASSCCGTARSSGTENRERLRFLEWLREYLVEAGVQRTSLRLFVEEEIVRLHSQ